MKVSKLLAMSALLLAGSGAAEAALVDGVRQKPQPQTTAFEWNTTLYMYNTGVSKYFLGANSWNTRGSVSDKGYKVKITKHVEDGLEWDGSSAILNDSVETKKAWFKTFIADEAGNCWVDCVNQADSIWTLKSAGDAWRFGPGEYNNTYNSATYPDVYLGVKAGDEGNTPELWAFLAETDNIDWKFVSPEAYAAHQEALAVWAKAEQLRALFAEAQSLGVDISAAKAVYENEAATIEEIEAAITALDAAITAAKESLASVAEPKDLTSKIVNATYDDGNNNGWSGTGPTFGFGAAEHYNKTYNSYQKITGLPNGVYALSLSAFYRAGNSEPAYQNWKNKTAAADYAKLYAVTGEDSLRTAIMSPFEGVKPNDSKGGNESNVTDGEYTYYIPNNMETAANYFADGYYADNKVLVGITDGTLTIGIEKTQTTGGDWTLFDNWKLTYYGNKADAYQLWMNSVLDNYKGYAEPGEDVVYTYSVLDDYKAVLEAVKTAADKDAIFAAVKQLDAAKAELDANIAAWTALLKMVEVAREVAERPDSELAGSHKELLADYLDYDFEDILTERTLTTEEVIAETAKIEQMKDDAIKYGLVPGQEFPINNPGYEEGTTGWEGNPALGGDTNKCAEAYQKKFDVYQLVNGAPTGVYSVKVKAFFRDGQNETAWAKYLAAEGNVTSPVSVYLNSSTTPIKNVYDEKVEDPDYFDATTNPAPFEAEDNDGNTYWFANDMKNASKMFADGRYEVEAFGLVREGDVMRIGIKGDASASYNWAIWDDFKLIYEGFKADVIAPQLETAADALNAAADKTFGTEVREQIEGVINAAADALGQENGEVMFNALADVLALTDSIATSEAVFTELNNLIADFENAIVESENASVKAEASTLLDKMEAAVKNGGTVTTAEASALIASCKELTIRLALPEGTASVENPLDYTALIQTPDFEKDGVNSIEGWSGTSGYNFGNDDTQKSALMLEFYNKTFDLYQDIALANVPNGNYKLSLSAFYRFGSAEEDYNKWTEDPNCGTTKLYAVSGGETFETPVALLASGAGEEQVGAGSEVTVGDGLYVPNDMVSANAYFTLDNPRYLNELVVKVTDGKLRVGIKKDANVGSDWVIMDRWRLTYYGNDEVPDGIESIEGNAGAPVKVEYFSIDGMKLSKPSKGVVIKRSTDAAGNVTVKTVVVK